MNCLQAVTRRAACAVFLLFAAVLLVVAPAEASVPRSAGVHQVDAVALASLERPALGLASPTLEPSRFSLSEDLSVFATTNAQWSLGLCGLETSRCALTYARNNPLKYVDPDGRSAMAAIQRLPLLLPLLPTLGVPAGLAPLVATVSLVALGGYAGGRGVGEFMAHSPSLIPVRLAPDVVMLSAKPDTQFGEKIEGQLGPRGWTQEDVGNTIANPASTSPARDTRRRPDGTRNDAPATRYTNPDGSYVVRNDETGDIVQVSNRNDPKWKAPTDNSEKK